MSTRIGDGTYPVEEALARLAAEAGPGPALEARVLADAAMVSAERRPAAARPRARSRSALVAWIRGLFSRPGYGVAGAAVTVALTLAVVIGYGLGNGDDAGEPRRIDDALLSQLSPLDSFERELMAGLDEELFEPGAPL